MPTNCPTDDGFVVLLLGEQTCPSRPEAERVILFQRETGRIFVHLVSVSADSLQRYAQQHPGQLIDNIEFEGYRYLDITDAQKINKQTANQLAALELKIRQYLSDESVSDVPATLRGWPIQ